MKKIMIDIETLSLDPRALILSIGAVDFSAGKLGASFYVNVNAYEQTNRHLSPSTVLWWIKQSVQNPAAATALLGGEHLLLSEALLGLQDFVGPGEKEAWFNGPQFDAVVLRSAYDEVNTPTPWKYHEERDCRTVFKLAESEGWEREEADPIVVAHNAGDDARWQARQLLSALKYLNIHS